MDYLRQFFRGAHDPLSRVRQRDPYSHVTVVFHRDDRDVARLDISRGPCVAPPGRKRPLVGITNQEPGDPRMYESLFSLLMTSDAEEPWDSTVVDGEGRLDTFSRHFVDALAGLNREVLRRFDERSDDFDWAWEEEHHIAALWEPLVEWPTNVSTIWIRQHLGWVAAMAREAHDRNRRLYCWSGPGFDPWGPRLIEKYRSRVTLSDAD